MSDPSLRVNGLLTRPLIYFDLSLLTIAFREACKRDWISPSIARISGAFGSRVRITSHW
jgi:hypothetical protein